MNVKLARRLSLSILLAGFLLVEPVWAQNADSPPGGLDTGEDDFTPEPRPHPGWMQNEKALKSVKGLSAACFSACHGRAQLDKKPNTPNIAGQRYFYILKQLETFNKSNADADTLAAHKWEMWERSNVFMNSVTDKVDERMYAYIADYVSQMPCDQETSPPTQVPAGKPQALKLCASCHGEDGVGIDYNVPILAGQSYDYLQHQMVHIRDSARHEPKDVRLGWRTHPMMEPIIQRITILDINALAKYYAEQDCRGANAPLN